MVSLISLIVHDPALYTKGMMYKKKEYVPFASTPGLGAICVWQVSIRRMINDNNNHGHPL